MDKLIIIKWIIGLCVSLFVGHILTASSLVCLRKRIEGHRQNKKWKDFTKKEKICFYLGLSVYPPYELFSPHDPKPVHPAIIGLAERLFFTIIVAMNLGGAAISMVAWIGLKMVSSRPYREKRAQQLDTRGASKEINKERKSIDDIVNELSELSKILKAIRDKAPALGFEFAGLMGNLSSMFFALVGGLIIRGT